MDIAIDWDTQNFRGDWSVNSGDLDLDPGGLRSAVLVSLFSDRIASTDFQPPAGSPFDRHGWWGDTYEQDPIGSRLWQLNRAKKTDDLTLLIRARDFCLEALKWLLDDGVAATVNVDTSWLNPNAIGIRVVIAEPQSPPKTFNFSWAWDTTGTSPSSGQAQVIAPPLMLVPPGPPNNVSASQVTNVSVLITWTPPSVGTPPFVYTVLYRVTGTVPFIPLFAGASTALLVTGLNPHTQYDFEVQVSNA